MRKIQITMDATLVDEVDLVVKKLKTTRSAFTRKALNEALKRVDISMLEEKHKKGYELFPAVNREFSVWESEQEWGDD